MSSVNNIEIIRQRLAAGEVCIGMGVTFADPAISELIAEAEYDFSWLDMEHASLDHQTVLQHIVAHRGTRTAPFVRVPQNDVNVIKPVLDLAPAGIIVPQVSSGAEAEAVVHACRIGDECLIGMNSTVLDGAVVGSQSIIGANALVTQGTLIPEGSLVLGSPAKVIRPLTEEERADLKPWAQKYVDNSAYCLKHNLNVGVPLAT